MTAVARAYPLRVPRPYLQLIRYPQDCFWRQAVPDQAELTIGEDSDPTEEDRQSPVEHLVHRYPDRVVLLVSNRCALYCRFCMRKRRVGRQVAITWPPIQQAIDYIRASPHIREVILSGGDPLLRDDEQRAEILAALRRRTQIEIIRIHSCIPAVQPHSLVAVLQRFGPMFVNLHFNHPGEITPAAAAACHRLADAIIPLGSQSVLLRGVNDRAPVMRALMQRLTAVRVRPYALTTRTRWPEQHTSGYRCRAGCRSCRPCAVTFPECACRITWSIYRKVQLLPDYWRRKSEICIEVKNYKGRL